MRPSLLEGEDGVVRCWWPGRDPLYVAYHDDEWGRPERDEQKLFEMVVLDGFQAGLSWITILRKRENFRKAFAGFDAEKIARFTPARVEKLMGDAGIVRNRSKIEATVTNAQAVLSLRDEGLTLSELLWSFSPAPRRKRLREISEIPAETPESRALSKELRRRGFRFVGPTIVYAFMQSAGIVDDHVEGCQTAP